ncbi:MAG: hypothetical protein ACUVRY_00295 [Thermoanaerobaculaceae bacterium]
MITNEIGQFTDDPKQTTAVMGKIVELGLSIAVWFSLDGPKAKGLVNWMAACGPPARLFALLSNIWKAERSPGAVCAG